MLIRLDRIPTAQLLIAAGLLAAISHAPAFAQSPSPSQSSLSPQSPPGFLLRPLESPPSGINPAQVLVDRLSSDIGATSSEARRELTPSTAAASDATRNNSLRTSTEDSAASIEQRYQDLAAEVAILERMSNVVRAVSDLVRPSVVHISASKVEQKRGRTETVEEAGSGVIIEAGQRHWVLTNRHVVVGSRPSEIALKLNDGRRIFPTHVFADELTDVAILALEQSNLRTARMGDSDRVAIGDFVVAVGSPFGLSHSVTFGIISARGRRDLTLGEERIELQDFLQTDAAINPGNSGGPLINLRGEVIGLNTAIASNSGGGVGIGFAIPINMVNRIVQQLAEFGEVRRGYLGVSLDPDFDPTSIMHVGMASAGGALVKTVRDGSPAKKAGISVGDIITQFDRIDIESDDHLVTCVGLTPVGKDVDVIIYRNGKSYKTSVRISEIGD